MDGEPDGRVTVPTSGEDPRDDKGPEPRDPGRQGRAAIEQPRARRLALRACVLDIARDGRIELGLHLVERATLNGQIEIEAARLPLVLVFVSNAEEETLHSVARRMTPPTFRFVPTHCAHIEDARHQLQ